MNNMSKKINLEFEYIGAGIFQANFKYDLNWLQRILVKLKLKKRPHIEIISIEGINNRDTDKNNILSEEEE